MPIFHLFDGDDKQVKLLGKKLKKYCFQSKMDFIIRPKFVKDKFFPKLKPKHINNKYKPAERDAKKAFLSSIP